MAEGLNLPRIPNMNNWMITKDDINKMKEEDLIKEVEAQKTKVMVTDGMVSVVMVSPDLYNTFIEAVDKLAATLAAPAPAAE